MCACTVLAAVLSPAHKCLVADWSHCSRIPCAFVSVQPGWDHYLRRHATSFTSLSPAGCCNAADGFPPPLNVSTEWLTASLSVPLSLVLFASLSLSLSLSPSICPLSPQSEMDTGQTTADRRSVLSRSLWKTDFNKNTGWKYHLIAACLFWSSNVSHARDNEDGLRITSSMLSVVVKVHRSSTWVKVQIRILKYYSSKSKSTAFSILLEWKYKSTPFFMYLSKKVLIDRFILQFYIDLLYLILY